MKEDIFTADQVAKMLELHPKTVRRFIREGKLKANKVGGQWRVMKADLSSFMGNVNLEKNAIQSFTVSKERDSYKKELQLKVQVSSVVDLFVENKTEADRVSAMVFAAMNSRGSEHSSARCDFLFDEKEGRARFMFWGSPEFMSTMLNLISEITN